MYGTTAGTTTIKVSGAPALYVSSADDTTVSHYTAYSPSGTFTEDTDGLSCFPICFPKVILTIPLLFTLYLLPTNAIPKTANSNEQYHIAVVAAVNLHKPSLRVFHTLTEISLLLISTSVALKV